MGQLFSKLPMLTITLRIHGTGIFAYIWLIFMVNVGKYTIHGSYGLYSKLDSFMWTFIGENGTTANNYQNSRTFIARIHSDGWMFVVVVRFF